MRYRAEILTAAAWIVGWVLITFAVAEIAPPRIVWPASGGLLLMSAGGIRLLGRVAGEGLYILTRDNDG